MYSSPAKLTMRASPFFVSLVASSRTAWATREGLKIRDVVVYEEGENIFMHSLDSVFYHMKHDAILGSIA